MIKVALLGSVGTGKDTLTRSLSAKLTRFSPIKGRRCRVRDIQEFSVLWTDKTGNTTEVFEQFYIWYKQKQWDHDFDERRADPFTVLISAAPSPLAYFYTIAFADVKNRKHRLLLEDLYGKAMYELYEFDVVFYLPIEFQVPEGDRLRKRHIRNAVDHAIQAFLITHKIPFIELRGSEEQRVRKAFTVLRRVIQERTKTNE